MKVKVLSWAALALALLCGVLYLANLRSDVALLESNLATANQTILDLQAAGERYELAIKARDSVDSQYTQELSNARSENDSLRAAVADGRKRLLVKATCPVRSGSYPGTTGVVDAGTAELDPAARQDYFDLRSQLITTEKTLAGLQAYVALVCLKR